MFEGSQPSDAPIVLLTTYDLRLSPHWRPNLLQQAGRVHLGLKLEDLPALYSKE